MIHIEDMDAHHLDILISEYNWDNGFRVPQMVADNKNCELATALKLFYLADGYSYLLRNIHNNDSWIKFISSLYDRIVMQHFSKGNLSYKIPLSKTQLYKLKQSMIPDVFVTDV